MSNHSYVYYNLQTIYLNIGYNFPKAIVNLLKSKIKKYFKNIWNSVIVF